MKKLLLIELEGGLLQKGDADPLTRLQPGVIYWLNKIIRETAFSPVLVTRTGYPVALQQMLQEQGLVFEQQIEDSHVAINEGETWVISQGTDGLRAGNYKQVDWERIWQLLKGGARVAEHRRTTNETDIRVKLNLDGTGQAKIETGLHFLDHMLQQIARHGGMDLEITAKGDLHIDEHHTIEDTAITLGEAMAIALGDKRGMERYGFCLPMDDALAQVAIDFGGRNWIVWEAVFTREKVGDVPTEMFFHFFKSFSDAARCNLNIKAEGSNEHHKIEAIFKAFARAIKMAVQRNLNNNQLPTTKGLL